MSRRPFSEPLRNAGGNPTLERLTLLCRLLTRGLLLCRLLLCRHSVFPLLGLGYHWTDLRAQPYLYRYTVYERAFSLLINKTNESEESSKIARHIQG